MASGKMVTVVIRVDVPVDVWDREVDAAREPSLSGTDFLDVVRDRLKSAFPNADRNGVKVRFMASEGY